ncbi:MAG: hypothetical protein KGI75_07220 [Rhizobiaceae bacterium]|nr:hypothetical protein [Rhizobiaceae bacterium]
MPNGKVIPKGAMTCVTISAPCAQPLSSEAAKRRRRFPEDGAERDGREEDFSIIDPRKY